jgi:hypothetical protein
MVAPASPTAGVDSRRDYALSRRRLYWRPCECAGLVTETVATIAVMDGPARINLSAEQGYLVGSDG